jgi:NADH:ubiquinone oxidoreductase subunit 5 (subunit L)/multisubunit Na+/H+ antiporter MnhA subunit
LAYHAVSQVGYMVLGIGTGSPLGIAGGLFHMLNHSIYKACLFLTGGAVQLRTGETDLDRLGGLARLMPLTWICFLVAAFSISGVPPFNGFASKWMIYQALIQAGQEGDRLWALWLAAAMFGSALTLASFMKLAHGVFLGVPPPDRGSRPVREVGFGMAAPMTVLAALCVVFGVFAFQIPIRLLVEPAVPAFAWIGMWRPGLATVLVLAGIAAGFGLFYLGNLESIRRTDAFVGGETLPAAERVTGVAFLKTVRETPGLRAVYGWAEAKAFDVYEQGARLALAAAGLLRRAHTGVLTLYLSWLLAGLVAVLFVLMRG